MQEFKDRLSAILHATQCSQSSAADKLNVSPAFISQLCSGARLPSDRTILDICRTWGVNEIWLRTGDGEMFAAKTREEELAEIFARLQYNDDAKSQLICAIARMPDEAFPAFLAFVTQLCKNLTEEAEEAEK